MDKSLSEDDLDLWVLLAEVSLYSEFKDNYIEWTSLHM